jgi:hypothetical protein
MLLCTEPPALTDHSIRHGEPLHPRVDLGDDQTAVGCARTDPGAVAR